MAFSMSVQKNENADLHAVYALYLVLIAARHEHATLRREFVFSQVLRRTMGITGVTSVRATILP